MLEIAFIIAVSVLFLHACTWDGMILAQVHYLLEDKLPVWIRKPLYDCPVCMTPWYGSVYLLAEGYPFGGTVICVAAAAGINVVLQQLIVFRRKCNCGSEERVKKSSPEAEKPQTDLLHHRV